MSYENSTYENCDECKRNQRDRREVVGEPDGQIGGVINGEVRRLQDSEEYRRSGEPGACLGILRYERSVREISYKT